MFVERMNQIMELTGARNKQIATYAKLDPSSLSRLRGGTRIPPKKSPTMQKAANGIYLCFDDQNRLEELCLLIGTDPSAPPYEIQNVLIEWLYEGESLPQRSRVRSYTKRKSECKTFGRRLDAAMNLAEYSNIRFSHLVNVDTSLISRFRSGVRTPSSNPAIAERIVTVLWNRIEAMGKLTDLSRLMAESGSDLDRNTFRQWLCDFDEFDSINARMAEQLSDSFGAAFSTAAKRVSMRSEEVVSADILDDTKDIYRGYDGLRNAVLRFLGCAARERAEELLLYSDQNMEWMTGDEHFLRQWASLMSACVKNGTQIRIIHNIERSLDEMNSAIASWLPLYISGMIESYYHTVPANGRLSFTLFLYPGHACIRAGHVVGMESTGEYHYLTESDELQNCMNAFRSLMKNCRPLVRVLPDNTLPEPTEDLTIIRPTLSVSTMPEELIDSFACEPLKEEWKKRNRDILKLSQYHLYDCLPLAGDEALFEGRIPVETLPGIQPLYYTREQYVIHIRHLISLSEQYPNYRIIPLPELPFPDIRLQICDEYVRTTHTCQPFVSMEFTHPLMCHAFEEYASRLIREYKVDRKTLIHMLKTRFL